MKGDKINQDDFWPLRQSSLVEVEGEDKYTTNKNNNRLQLTLTDLAIHLTLDESKLLEQALSARKTK